MEGYLRIGLLIVAAVILVLMVYESRYRRKLIRAIESTPEPYNDNSVYPKENENEFMEVEIDANPKLVSIPKPAAVVPKNPEPTKIVQDIVVMSVVAKPGQRFASYDLLQAIATAGMQYGAMKIFHYQLSSPTGKTTLFSLASMTKPGTFDLDNMGDLTCVGLTLFMNLAEVPNAEQALDLMIKTAQQLTDDLDGVLRAGQKDPWNEQTLNQYRQKTVKYVRRN